MTMRRHRAPIANPTRLGRPEWGVLGTGSLEPGCSAQSAHGCLAQRVARLSVAVLCLAALVARAGATPVVTPHVQVELVTDAAAIAAGHDVTIGVRFVLEDGWHVYWRNPGDSGTAPSIEWILPAGFTAGEVQWPTPTRIAVGPLMNFGYSGAVLLPATLHVPRDLASRLAVGIRAQVKWLVCNPDECIPGEAPLSLALPVGMAAGLPGTTQLFDEVRPRLPVTAPQAWRLSATAAGDTLTLVVLSVAEPLTPPPLFFPYSREAIEPAAPQSFALERNGFRLTLQRWRQWTTTPTSIDGVLTVGARSYAIAVPIAAPRIRVEPLALAFVGGMLLNFMPCVFPVLALKALALLGLASEGRRRARRHAVVYALGVVASFWGLAGALLAVRAGGAQLGWGFQLQSPIFVAGLAALFFWMALTLLGVSSIGTSIMGVGNKLTVGDGYRSAFFTGILATLVATPCTAPFMGTALGYALAQPPVVSLAVFTSLGLGLALPYVAVTFVPALGPRLPRPGPWMETLKQLLAFPLLATVVWLIWVASLQGGSAAVLAILTALLLLGFAAWVTGRWAGGWAQVAATVAVAGALLVGGSIAPKAIQPPGASETLTWEPYSAARLEEFLRQGRPVFVDFTAAWCVTCQVNERLALETAAVMAKMREIGVVPVRADWTRPNPDVTRALQQFGRDGVPLYVLYSGRQDDPPRILPQLLTSESVVTELEQLGTRRRT
jgi:thiol:disulfide interchange protein